MKTYDAHVPDTSGQDVPRTRRPTMGAVNLKRGLPDNLRGLDPGGCGCIFLGLGVGVGFALLCEYIGQAVVIWVTHH